MDWHVSERAARAVAIPPGVTKEASIVGAWRPWRAAGEQLLNTVVIKPFDRQLKVARCAQPCQLPLASCLAQSLPVMPPARARLNHTCRALLVHPAHLRARATAAIPRLQTRGRIVDLALIRPLQGLLALTHHISNPRPISLLRAGVVAAQEAAHRVQQLLAMCELREAASALELLVDLTDQLALEKS